jgi:hypothetical protein
MCLHPHEVPSVPDETARIARAAFRKGTVFMRMRDDLGTIYTDEAFAALFPSRGQPAESVLCSRLRARHGSGRFGAVETLRRIWLQQYYVENDVLRWRTNRLARRGTRRKGAPAPRPAHRRLSNSRPDRQDGRKFLSPPHQRRGMPGSLILFPALTHVVPESHSCIGGNMN